MAVLEWNWSINTWNRRKAYPFGGKYDFDSALCGQSTTSGPNRRNDVVISSIKHMDFIKNEAFFV